jgi:FG-GAP repeat
MRRIIVTLAVAAVATGISVVRTGVAHAVTPGSILASLIDPGGTPGDDFSISAVSIDGATAVVGASGNQGVAYIYVRGSHGWPTSPTVTLQDPLKSGDIFGNSVSVSGSTIVVGAYGTNFGQGAAYIYEKGPHGWPTTPTVTLADPAATPGSVDLFGSSVGTANGNEVVVGALGTNSLAGAAYIYVKGESGWPTSPTTTLADPGTNTISDEFGSSVAVAGDTTVVGAFGTVVSDAFGNNFFAGAAYIYVKGSQGWPKMPTVTLADPTAPPASDEFGSSVATANGTTIVGAPVTNVGGAAYIYVRGTNGWPAIPTATLAAPPNETNGDFGVSVAVGGGTAVVGADLADTGGAAYTYINGTNGWPTTPTTTVTAPALSPFGYDLFGGSVAVDGHTAIAGDWVYLGDFIQGGIGAAYIYVP